MEQCWHGVPGGTAVAALRVARELAARDDVTLLGVAGRHRAEPADPWVPPVPIAHLPLGGPWLYEAWLRARWPKVERATGPVDVAHATTIIPCPSDAPLVCTIHDLAFVHEPEHFTRHGVRVFERSLRIVRERGAVVLCSSAATVADCRTAGLPADRLRVVPLGVDVAPATADDVRRVRDAHRLPPRFALFVGTIEPRKNLANLAAAVERRARAAARRRRRRGLGRRRARRRRALPRVRARTPISPGSTPPPPSSATRACARATACRCSRPWHRAPRS